MTSSNIVDTTRSSGNGHATPDRDKTPEEIQLEIARTRSAITEDLLAISEKLSPQHLREGAREVMRDARDEAKEMLRGAKDAAIDSLIGVKDRAVESVSEKVSLLGTQAKRASDLTVSFVSANAVAVSLVGFGIGFLLVALQRRSSLARLDRRPRLRESFGDERYVLADPPPRWSADPQAHVPVDQVRGVGSAASHAVDQARAEAWSRSAQPSASARDGARVEARHLARGRGTVARRARRIASDNRVAVVAVTVVAGLGLGLLWPTGGSTRRVPTLTRSRAY